MIVAEDLVSPSPESTGPLCPHCGRRIAAWRMDHCVYCGAVFPAELKQGFAEPEALKWVDRPKLPPDAARQLEMWKVIPQEKKRRSGVALFGIFAMPVFAILFYLLYRIVARYSGVAAMFVAIAGAGFLAYLAWSLFKPSS